MKFRLLPMVIFSALFLASQSTAVAEDNVDDSELTNKTRLMRQVTVFGSKEDVGSTPGSGAYLDAADITEQNYNDIHKIIRKVPGVYVREEEGYGLFPNISLRGADPGRSNKVTLMEDGILTAPAPYSAPSAYYAPNAGRMNAIEILKGSSQVKYGPHTTGGVINYISTPIPDKFTFFTNNSYGNGAGNDNQYISQTYFGDTIETFLGKFGYLAELYARYNEGFKKIEKKFGFDNRDDTGLSLIEPMVKLSFEPDTDMYQRLEAKLGFTWLDASTSYLGLTDEDFDNNPYRLYSASRFDNIDTFHMRSYLRYFAQFLDNLGFTSTGYFNYFHRNWFKARANGNNLLTPAALAVLKGDAAGSVRYRNNNRYYYLLGLDNKFNLDFEVGPTEHDVEFGYRLHYDQVRRDQSNVTFTQDAVGTFIREVNAGPGSGGNRRQQTIANSFYIEDSIALGDFTVKPGIRYERLKQLFDDNNAGVSRQGWQDMIAPGVSGIYKVSDNASIYGGYHRGFSPSSPRDNTFNGIDNETSDGWEIGSRFQAKGVNAEAAFFWTRFNDLIVPDNIGGGGGGATANVGSIDSYGVEFFTEIDPGERYDWGFEIPLYGSFTYTEAQLNGDAASTDTESIFAGGFDGADVPYIPQFQFQVGAGVEFKKWDFHLTGTYVDRSFTTATNSTLQFDPVANRPDARFGVTDAFFTLDAAVNYHINDNVTAYVSASNITNREYIVSRHPIGPRPGRPFSALAGVKIKLGGKAVR